MYFVYLLRCADGTLYTGCTNDLDRRLAAHNAGKGAKYTRSRRPVVLVYREQAAGPLRRPPAGTGHQAAHPETEAGADPKQSRFRPGTASFFAIIRKKLLTLIFPTDIIL